MSRFSRLPHIVGGIALAVIIFGLGYGLALRGRGEAALTAAPAPAGAAQVGEKKAKILYWTCAMHPQIHVPGPGQCPICGMNLIPVREGGGGAGSLREYVTSEEAAKLLQIEVSPVERRFVDAHVRMVGKVAYDETRLKYITAWLPGRLQRLFVDYTGVEVARGDHMVQIYSPELLAAQEELLQAQKAVGQLQRSSIAIMRETAQKTVESARSKLRLWGLNEQQVDQILQRGSAADTMTIYAPIGGTVVHKNAMEGMYVQPGTKLYTVADLSHVWLMLDAYETDLPWLRYGQDVSIDTVAYPGETFRGRIVFIDPTLNPATRTVRVRVDVPNPEGKLKPEMFAHAVVDSEVAAGGRVMAPDLAGKWICPLHPDVIEDGPGDCPICGQPLVTAESLGYVAVDKVDEAKPLVIPATAALVTGKRAVVYVKVPDAEAPTFEGRQIVLGPRAGDYYLVRSGLKEGEMVVTRGNFNIDSALQIQAKPSMMTPEGGGHEGPMDASAMTADEKEAVQAFAMQLGPVTGAAGSVAEAVKARKLEDAKAAFMALGDAVDKVDPGALSGEPPLMWNELGMLLKNDAVEGAGSVDMADAARVQAELKRHVERLTTYFGLKPQAMPAMAGMPGMEGMPGMQAKPAEQPAPAQSPALQAPAQFRAQLSGVWRVYRDMGAALAADDGAAAAKAAGQAQGALDDVDMSPLQGEAMMMWMADLLRLQSDFAAAVEAGQDLDALRAAFAALSEDMAAAIRSFGVAPGEVVYELHCPMAFGGKGANWLQADDEARNPYFGQQMPNCSTGAVLIAGESPPQPQGATQ